MAGEDSKRWTGPASDLANHAADKVGRALNDVLAIESDPSARMQIALLASAVTIGAAAGNLRFLANRDGIMEVSQDDAIKIIFEILLAGITKNVDAVMRELAGQP